MMPYTTPLAFPLPTLLETFCCACVFSRYDVMGLIFFIIAARVGYVYALKFIRHLSR